MTDNDDTLTPTTPVENREPVHPPIGPPLKAERIQWFLVGLDLGNRPYDFASESEAERNARLEAGWRKRTSATRTIDRDAA